MHISAPDASISHTLNSLRKQSDHFSARFTIGVACVVGFVTTPLAQAKLVEEIIKVPVQVSNSYGKESQQDIIVTVFSGLVRLGARVHALSRFKTLPFDVQRVSQALQAAFDNPDGRYVCFVATDAADQVAGGLLAVLERHIFSDQISASIMHFDVLPEKRAAGHAGRLIKAFEAWCKNRQMAEINFGINSVDDQKELDRLGRFAMRLGYRKIGESYVK